LVGTWFTCHDEQVIPSEGRNVSPTGFFLFFFQNILVLSGFPKSPLSEPFSMVRETSRKTRKKSHWGSNLRPLVLYFTILNTLNQHTHIFCQFCCGNFFHLNIYVLNFKIQKQFSKFFVFFEADFTIINVVISGRYNFFVNKSKLKQTNMSYLYPR
jgi:hypothetical protein